MWYLICSENRRRSSKTIQFVHDTFLSKTKWSKINSFQRITQINIFNVVFICPWLEHLWKKRIEKDFNSSIMKYPPSYSRNNYGTFFPSIQENCWIILYQSHSLFLKRIVAHQTSYVFSKKRKRSPKCPPKYPPFSSRKENIQTEEHYTQMKNEVR